GDGAVLVDGLAVHVGDDVELGALAAVRALDGHPLVQPLGLRLGLVLGEDGLHHLVGGVALARLLVVFLVLLRLLAALRGGRFGGGFFVCGAGFLFWGRRAVGDGVAG